MDRRLNIEMITGSVRLRGVSLSFPQTAAPVKGTPAAQTTVEAVEPVTAPDAAPIAETPVEAVVEAPVPVVSTPVVETPAPSMGKMFEWAVPGGDLGTHHLNDQMTTTISATYGGVRVRDYAISAGTLPPDIVLEPVRGILAGRLKQSGQYAFTIRAKIEGASSDASYVLTVI